MVHDARARPHLLRQHHYRRDAMGAAT